MMIIIERLGNNSNPLILFKFLFVYRCHRRRRCCLSYSSFFFDRKFFFLIFAVLTDNERSNDPGELIFEWIWWEYLRIAWHKYGWLS